MKEYKIYIAGEFRTTSKILEIKNSYTSEVIAKTYLAENSDLEKAIVEARNSMPVMKELPVYERYNILMTLSRELSEKKNFFSEILSMEACKPLKYALGEVDRAIQTLIIAAEEAKRLPGEYLSADWTKAGHGKEAWVKYFPVGIVAGIAPFNFPINLAMHKVAPAIAAGCPIILKPSSSTPLSMLEFAKLVDNTNLPKGAFSVLPMDRITGNNLVTDERIKLLTFTGSPEVGWKMKADAGKKKVVLELGGNAGVIISKSADIDEAVNKCVVGGFAFSGQVCIHTQRIYVEKDVFKEFTEKFVSKVEKLKIGQPLDPETDISAMIDENNAIRVEQWVNEAVDNGAKILCGGTRKGSVYSPTVLTQTNPNMKVCSLEVFGPVVILEPFDNFEKEVEIINNSNYGLQAGVFTNNLSEMNYAFNNIDVGGVIINDVPTFRVDHAPYGGIKDSGLGREGVKYAIHDMLEPKVLIKPIL
jgi:glyceraldehyde-3-phosphate dehydrogenase (NADP+)